ncbi:uncharacterized protein LOC116666096 [Camelus ferus]|uniref:Uncharacterized protein LOC116666096 n=1 Tax=Camelus ferus TaxID=419612 RepID=A0A8B8TQF0_CAMFR|nr:uncharacterized protein LOC116666096 [Camelus ferus]
MALLQDVCGRAGASYVRRRAQSRGSSGDTPGWVPPPARCQDAATLKSPFPGPRLLRRRRQNAGDAAFRRRWEAVGRWLGELVYRERHKEGGSTQPRGPRTRLLSGARSPRPEPASSATPGGASLAFPRRVSVGSTSWLRRHPLGDDPQAGLLNLPPDPPVLPGFLEFYSLRFGGCGSSVFLGVEGVPPSAMDSPSLSRYRWSLFTIWSTNHTLTYLMGPVDSTGPAMLMEAEGRAWKSPTYQIPVAVPIYILPTSVQRFPFLHILTDICCSCSF